MVTDNTSKYAVYFNVRFKYADFQYQFYTEGAFFATSIHLVSLLKAKIFD